jgi:hypothetical protein
MGNQIPRPKAPRILPLGYRYVLGAEGREIVVDENVAQHIRLAFALAALGKVGIREIAAEVAARGVRGRRGELVGATALWMTLTDPFLTGFIEVGGSLVPSGYPAVIVSDMFEQVQNALIRRQRNPSQTKPRQSTSENPA